jgi:DNA mismatch repair ATPase MutL
MRRAGAGRHARGARAHHLREAEDGRAGSNLRSQLLLVPLNIAVSAKEAAAAEEHAEALAEWGLELSRSGPSGVVVRRIPALLEGADVAQLTRDVLPNWPSTAVHAGCRNWRTNCCRPWPATVRCAPAGV